MMESKLKEKASKKLKLMRKKKMMMMMIFKGKMKANAKNKTREVLYLSLNKIIIKSLNHALTQTLFRTKTNNLRWYLHRSKTTITIKVWIIRMLRISILRMILTCLALIV